MAFSYIVALLDRRTRGNHNENHAWLAGWCRVSCFHGFHRSRSQLQPAGPNDPRMLSDMRCADTNEGTNQDEGRKHRQERHCFQSQIESDTFDRKDIHKRWHGARENQKTHEDVFFMNTFLESIDFVNNMASSLGKKTELYFNLDVVCYC